MDRYQRVERPKAETAINQNEIRVTTQGLIRNYVSYASSLLQDKATPEIVLKAMGQAISKAVAIAEIIKRRVPGLHQITAISSTSITDVWEPIEEGLLPGRGRGAGAFRASRGRVQGRGHQSQRGEDKSVADLDAELESYHAEAMQTN